MPIPVNIDGVGKVNFPDDYTPDRIKFSIENDILPRVKAQNSLPDPEQGADRASLLSSAPMRFAKGLKDTIDAPAQILSNIAPDWLNKGLDAATQAVHNIPVVGPIIKGSNLLQMPSETDKNIRQSNAEYEQARQAAAPTTLDTLITGKRDPGFDAMRFAGDVVGPGNRLIPGGAPTTRLGRMGLGAAQGAVAAGLQPVTGDQDFLTAKATQIGLGGIGGAILQPIISKVTDVVSSKIGDLINKFSGKLSQQEIDREAMTQMANAFKQQGVDIATVPPQILDSVRGDVKKAITEGALTNPAEIARKADFKSLGMDPTVAQISRDPTQFAQEKNMRGIVWAGEPLANRFNQQNSQLINALNTRGATGATGTYATSEGTLGALKAVDETNKNIVGALYDKAKDNLGRAAPLDARAATEQAGQRLAEEHAAGSLPAAARSILNDVATGKIPFNVDTKEGIVKSLYRMSKSPDGSANYAVGLVRDALDNAPLVENHGLGPDALNAFRAARTAHAQRMNLQDQVPALKAAVENEAPDDFFQKFILNGDKRDTAAMTGILKQSSPQTVDRIKSQIVDYLKSKALNQASDEVGIFSQSNYNKALDNLNDKLPVFFNKQEVADLQRVGRVASYIQAQPAGSAVNNANTASAAMNLLSKVGKATKTGAFVDKFINQPIQEAADKNAVADALAAKLSTLPRQSSAAAVGSAKLNSLLRKAQYPIIAGAGTAIGAQQ